MAEAQEVDAHSPTEVAEAVRTWLEGRYGGRVYDVEPPHSNGAGRATLIHLVRFAGPDLPSEWTERLVVRIHQTVSEAEASAREAAIQEWCAERGYPAPRVLALFAPGEVLTLPVQVMERAPGVAMLDAVKHAPWKVPQMIDRLVALQLKLHSLPLAGWPEGPGSRLADRRLGLTRRVAAASQDVALTAALDRVELLLPELADAPTVVCHGDFHPLNILVSGRDTSVIDWTDCALADRHGDVARTAWLLRFGVPLTGMSRPRKAALSRAQTWLGSRYLRAYQRVHPLDPDRLRRWHALQFLDAWGQTIQHEQQSDAPPDSSSGEAIAWLRQQLDLALA